MEDNLEFKKKKAKSIPKIVIGIVSSAGGPPVLKEIIKNIKSDFSFSILIAQHISEGFMSNFAKWLENETFKKVKIVKQRETIRSGIIYLPPDGYHITLSNERIELLNHSPINGIRPSGDLLLKSIARSYGKNTIGIILTGMGRDGVEGIAEIFKSGGITIAQSTGTAFIKSMPQEAINLGIIKYILTPEEIAKFLSEIKVK